MGFDSIKWEAGYTALHYAAEHIDDARSGLVVDRSYVRFPRHAGLACLAAFVNSYVLWVSKRLLCP